MRRAPVVYSGERAVVVGVDGSPGSRRALAWAADEASLRDAVLRVVHAGDVSPGEAGVGSATTPGGTPRALVDDAAGEARAHHPLLAVRAEILRGPAMPALVEAAEVAELLVLGPRRRGALSARLGSVARHCVRHAPCPVAVVHGRRGAAAGAGVSARGIVVGVDGSVGSDHAVRWALEEGRRRGVEVTAVHAWQQPLVGELVAAPSAASEHLARQVEAHVRGVAARAGAEAGFRAESRVGAVVPTLVEVSEDADLLVVGARGYNLFHDVLLGSVASRCAEEARCPVVVVRPPRTAPGVQRRATTGAGARRAAGGGGEPPASSAPPAVTV